SSAATSSASVSASTTSTSETFGVASTGSSFLLSSAMDRLLPEVARRGTADQFGPVLLGHRVQRLDVRTADVLRLRAARVERAAARDARQVRRQPLDRVQLLALLVQARDRVQQRSEERCVGKEGRAGREPEGAETRR